MTAVNFPSLISLLEPSRVSNHFRSLPATGKGAHTDLCPSLPATGKGAHTDLCPSLPATGKGAHTDLCPSLPATGKGAHTDLCPDMSRSSSVGGELLAKENCTFFFAHSVLCHKVLLRWCLHEYIFSQRQILLSPFSLPFTPK